ncbi:elongation factor P hydroxylase [Glaciecola sp. XM2]|uniref:elongation factor P hydroxylase n=1 Tax=Glaciecola sp. XM2 TaxID=1914931 RepID=UPI0020326496|nr:elongation factor P hydroxylase [Glaciecola sp. XM2]
MQYTYNSVHTPSLFSTSRPVDGTSVSAYDLMQAFNAEFADEHLDKTARTYLIGGASEPIYLPASELVCTHFDESDNNAEQATNGKIRWLNTMPLSELPFGNKIFFTRDYAASALHEVAHWCIAGEQRRTQIDYGYWYAPDGRDAALQAKFEQAEVKPQAVEWAFSLACGMPFKVSNDNLALDNYDNSHFQQAVEKQLDHYLSDGLPPRAQRFFKRLKNEVAQSSPSELVLC